MKAVTIRGIEPEVAEKLKETASKKGTSVNQLAIDIIKDSLGLQKKRKYTLEFNDLDDLFGRWSESEFEEISSRISKARRIDPELWT